MQNSGENVSSFLSHLKILALNCDFNDVSYEAVENQNIRDQFYAGLNLPKIRKRLLAEKKFDP